MFEIPAHRKIGVELEVAGHPLKWFLDQHIAQKHGIVQAVVHDGSIRPEGAEIRIGPYLPSSAYLDSFTKLIRYLKQEKCYVNNTCGLHIHVDIDKTNHMNGYYGVYMYERTVKEQWLKYITDNSKQLSKFVPFEKRGRNYCNLTFSSPRGIRYSAVNPRTSYDTLEFRLFNSHLSIRWLAMCARFAIEATDWIDGELRKLSR